MFQRIQAYIFGLTIIVVTGQACKGQNDSTRSVRYSTLQQPVVQAPTITVERFTCNLSITFKGKEMSFVFFNHLTENATLKQLRDLLRSNQDKIAGLHVQIIETKDTPYKMLKKVINLLEANGINQFNLRTEH